MVEHSSHNIPVFLTWGLRKSKTSKQKGETKNTIEILEKNLEIHTKQ